MVGFVSCPKIVVLTDRLDRRNMHRSSFRGFAPKKMSEVNQKAWAFLIASDGNRYEILIKRKVKKHGVATVHQMLAAPPKMHTKKLRNSNKRLELQARIVLLVESVLRVVVPVRARALVLLGGRVGDLVGHLEELHAEALADVPRDVAVQQPGARVVGGEGDGEPAAAGQSRSVAARGSVPVQHGGAGVVDAAALADDEVVVAVEVWEFLLALVLWVVDCELTYAWGEGLGPGPGRLG